MPYHCPEVADRAVALAEKEYERSIATAHAKLARFYDDQATHELVQLEAKENAKLRHRKVPGS